MPLIQVQKDLRIFQDEDFSITQVSEDFIGRKAYSLFKLRSFDVPVPPFFALSSSIFSEYIAANLGTSLDTNPSPKEIAQKLTNGVFPEETTKEISAAYSRLSGFTDTWVAVRSSIVLPAQFRSLAFAGMLDTILNVRGINELEAAIRKVYASLFNDKIAAYAMSNGLSLSDIKVAILVQKMVQAETSGIVFTVDPISLNKNLLTIESVFGFGDVIASGEITPDQYIIDKDTLKFHEKRILPQEWMMVRRITHNEQQPGEQKVKISKAWQSQPKLDNRYVEELSKIAIVIEKKTEAPQDIEWVFEGGKIWILQTRNSQPVLVPHYDVSAKVKLDKTIIDSIREITERQNAKAAVKHKIEESKKKPFVAKPIQRLLVKTAVQSTMSDYVGPREGERLLLTGVGSSTGVFRGKVKIIASPEDYKLRRKEITKNIILVTTGMVEGMDRVVNNAGAVISDTGGLTSDIAITCREKGVPCIMGTQVASRMLHENEEILVDGTVGAIYGEREYHKNEIQKQPLQPKVSKMMQAPIAMPIPTPTSIPTAIPAQVKAETKQELNAKTPSVQPQIQPEVPVLSKPSIRTATKLYIDISESYLKSKNWQKYVTASDGIADFRIEDIYQVIGRHPEAFIEEGKSQDLAKTISTTLSEICQMAGSNPVIASVGSITVGLLKKLTRGKFYENWPTEAGLSDKTMGLDRILNRSKEMAVLFRAIRRTRNVDGWRNLLLTVDYASTPAKLIEFKKNVTAGKLRRSSSFKFFVNIDTPSEALIAADFAKCDIDGLIINMKTLTKQMMAPSQDDDSMIKLIENIKSAAKDLSIIIKVSEECPNLIKKVIKLGITGIAVSAEKLDDTRNLVAKTEQELILK